MVISTVGRSMKVKKAFQLSLCWAVVWGRLAGVICDHLSIKGRPCHKNVNESVAAPIQAFLGLSWSGGHFIGSMGREVNVTLPDTEVVQLVMPDNNLVEQALGIFGRLWDSLVYMEEERVMETSKENLKVILLLILLILTFASLCLCLLAILCCTCRAAR